MSASSGTFRHEPLDHSIKSIRVIRILPNLSGDGLIQCEIKNTTIKDDYSCLSYVWGKPSSHQAIMVNGARLTVRQNLFDFLENTRPMTIYLHIGGSTRSVLINIMALKEITRFNKWARSTHTRNACTSGLENCPQSHRPRVSSLHRGPCSQVRSSTGVAYAMSTFTRTPIGDAPG